MWVSCQHFFHYAIVKSVDSSAVAADQVMMVRLPWARKNLVTDEPFSEFQRLHSLNPHHLLKNPVDSYLVNFLADMIGDFMHGNRVLHRTQ